ncbi:MAG: hypothetical protein A3E79_04640 [Burkholderiales bacterium RIFCSPHIGHO2_12_FULL_61_11]|nr:MAG: hypothetical protein A3E79_04640 [Burkholderiales bacterium RIFCSPHIGHO2_12_FULL_61_11]
MKTIRVSRQAKALNALLKRARHEKVILPSAQGDECILAEIDDFNREIELARQNKPLMKLLESRARQKATVSLEEAKHQLGLT